MTTQLQHQSPSQVLADEIAQLQLELPKLTAERQRFAQFPALPPDAKPAQVAERISASVVDSAPRIRGLDMAITTLQSTLATKRAQLATAKETERKEKATEKMAELHQQGIRQCERINTLTEMLEAEVSRLRQTERELAPARHVVMPGYPYPYLSVDETATVLKAGWSTVGCHLTVRPLRSS